MDSILRGSELDSSLDTSGPKIIMLFHPFSPHKRKAAAESDLGAGHCLDGQFAAAIIIDDSCRFPYDSDTSAVRYAVRNNIAEASRKSHDRDYCDGGFSGSFYPSRATRGSPGPQFHSRLLVVAEPLPVQFFGHELLARRPSIRFKIVL